MNEKTPAAVREGTVTGVFLAHWGRVPLASPTTVGVEPQVAALRAG
ncbi:MAG: hypothetical protein JWO22_2791 [Frankiales bacterium]|nr:hypothetical protein [Frankiales bacterium]